MTFMQDVTNFMRIALIWTSNDRLIYKTTYRVAQKNCHTMFLRLNLVICWLMYWCSILFHCQNQNICNNNANEDPTTPQVCR